ncbi:DUF6151 family protein [uncultured Tateyamaria sp.]|uniref:DUF6151 family protein n=1 Tax=Tateyamaria sp. 1078 TaxID=3417464 RepID=UPI00262B3FFC|nr:DUF6151 family protein [uncultured Tateyamaria sp.]
MAGADLKFACNCNTLRGTLVGAGPGTGTRVECFCHDCRAAEVYAGQPDPAPGAVQLYQTTPFRVRIDAGADQLAPFAFSEKGPLRWQARCCGATMFLTARSPKLSFTSFRTDRLADSDALGPVRARAFVRKPNGKRGHEGLAGFIAGFAARAIGARVSGRWKDTPFFDPDGRPVAEVHLVSKAERNALPLP